MSIASRLHTRLHRTLVFDRRRDRLVRAIDQLLPASSYVLDIGCGNGEIGAGLATAGHQVCGVEVRRRDSCAIPSCEVDGTRLPFRNDAVDWAILIDVLHHSSDAPASVREAYRVARRGLIIKDHLARNAIDRVTLGLMDWVGNHQFGVGRDGRYRSAPEWRELWAAAGLEATGTVEDLDLYPTPAKPLVERGLHFVARLEPVGMPCTDGGTSLPVVGIREG